METEMLDLGQQTRVAQSVRGEVERRGGRVSSPSEEARQRRPTCLARGKRPFDAGEKAPWWSESGLEDSEEDLEDERCTLEVVAILNGDTVRDGRRGKEWRR